MTNSLPCLTVSGAKWWWVALGQLLGVFCIGYSTRPSSKTTLLYGWVMFFLLDSTCWHLRMWMIQLNVLSSLSLITALKLDILHMKITGYCELCSEGWFTDQHNRQLLLASSDDFIPCCCFSNRTKLYPGWVSDPSHRFFFFNPLLYTCPRFVFFWLFWILKSMRVRNSLAPSVLHQMLEVTFLLYPLMSLGQTSAYQATFADSFVSRSVKPGENTT